ncbi:calpain-1 catalytic subunit [Larimichthys crocea]|uniref:calpain-1 catalytic subunit n=1 Tax=Larimichthys crocea TaxID=215358 RepID=UPI000F5E5428|nr:calpain-1 catalytic subunit [Larimichthys crocea]
MPVPGACMNILEARQKQEGYGSITNPEKFLNQNYMELKQYCLIKGVRYIDDMFPPDVRSIGQGLLSPADLKRVEWLRPRKIAPNPDFVLDGISRFDFGQGIVGDCWFLASIGALTFQTEVLGQVVPLEQAFDDSYCGLFHFRFWRFGRWVDVVIDDKLPTINGRLIFVHSKDPNEFWPALMEKAYAKVCGSYTDMSAGTPAEALMDFTGGVHMCVQLGSPPQNLWELMCRAGQSKSLMGCGTHEGETSENTVLPNGLVQGHAYTVTGVKQMKSQGKPINLVRLWNPWGKGEWTGDWSDQSSLWKTVSAEDREMCLSVADDGEFWMTLEDFCKFYSDLDICCLCPSFLDGSSSCHWKSSFYDGRWVAGTTAGGCMNNRDSFWTNPQYRVKVDGDYPEKIGTKNMLVSLMQKPDKRNRRLVQNLHIGFSVFEVTKQYKELTGKFPASFFTSHAPVAQTKTYMNAREVMEFFLLKPGEYLIVPSTFNANETASFILTILSKAETHTYENSGGHSHNHEPIENVGRKETNGDANEDVKKRNFFRQHSDKYEEVDAAQLQILLNNEILKGDLKSGGFSLDACRSMVALMDTSITGKLNGQEFVRLWNKVVNYRDIFFRTDVSRTGTLSLSELRNAFIASGAKVSDDMLNLMALRYASAGQVTLESFISLILRLDCMYKIFKQLSDGKSMSLLESEWIYVSMYT